MAADVASRRSLVGMESLSPEDFETASIRSAAPSYSSDAPSYHSTAPSYMFNEPIPPYTPRAAASDPPAFNHTPSSLLLDTPTTEPTLGLPPVPTGPVRSELPSLDVFRIPSWSTVHSNPAARHYHNVANRRLTQALTPATSRLNQTEEEARVRPLEDPYLVGEVAAARARRERLARENRDEVLIRENESSIARLGRAREESIPYCSQPCQDEHTWQACETHRCVDRALLSSRVCWNVYSHNL